MAYPLAVAFALAIFCIVVAAAGALLALIVGRWQRWVQLSRLAMGGGLATFMATAAIVFAGAFGLQVGADSSSVATMIAKDVSIAMTCTTQWIIGLAVFLAAAFLAWRRESPAAK